MLHGSDAIAAARRLALREHAEQTDKLGIPYSAHVEHVALQIRRFGPEFEITGWLHDICEDTPCTLDQIEETFGPVIRRGVDAITRRPSEDYFRQYLPRVMENQLAIHAKYADSRHNRAKAYLLADTKDRSRLERKYDRVLDLLVQAQPQLARWGDLERIEFDGEAWVGVP
jgi:(p)ppGpp synthase/HD superfamily hydrolase